MIIVLKQLQQQFYANETAILMVGVTMASQGQDIDHYIVEYYRDQWQLWLR